MVLFDKITLDLELIIKPVIYIFVGFIIYEIIRKILNNAENKSNIKKKHHQKRVKTITIPPNPANAAKKQLHANVP